MSDLNCIPPDQHPDQHDEGWALLRGMVITMIDEVKNSDASTDVNDSIEDVNDFPKDKNPLDEWRCGAVHLFPWVGEACNCYSCKSSSSQALIFPGG